MSAQPNTQSRDDEVKLLRESAETFVTKSMDHKRTRELRRTNPGYDPRLVKEMAELGWFGILVPESYGGLGLGFAEMAAVLDPLGRGLMGEPIVASAVLAARVIALGDDKGSKEKLLPALAEGKGFPSFAWQEGDGGLDPNVATSTASSDKAGAKLNGRKRFVAGGAGASTLLVSAKSSAGLAVYAVDAQAKGVKMTDEWRADGSPAPRVELSDAEASAVVASPAVAAGVIGRAVEEAGVMASAELHGLMTEALRFTLDYLKTRVQFGVPIGSFQSLQHKTVDLYIMQEVATSVLGDGIRAIDESSTSASDRSLAASRCKARLSDAAFRMTREAIQLHGAIGYTEELNVGLYLKRAMTLSAWLGNAGVHRQRFIAAGGLESR